MKISTDPLSLFEWKLFDLSVSNESYLMYLFPMKVIWLICFYDFSIGFWNCSESVVFIFFPFYYINNISIEFGVFLCQTDFVGVVPEIHIHDNGKKGGGSEWCSIFIC